MIKTISLTAPSGAANRAVGSYPQFKLLKQKDSESFNRYLQNGREIYPQYEPLFLLEAQYLYNENEYHKAKEVLNELIEINHRYGKAASLLKEVDKKLKIN